MKIEQHNVGISMTQRSNCSEILLDHITHNVQQIQRFFRPGVRFMAVVKGDAYGHGLIPVSQHLQDIGVRHFAVSNMDDAVLLRKNGIIGQILHIGVVEDGRLDELIIHQITPSICSLTFARKLSAALGQMNRTLDVHLRMDQGLGTVGIAEQEMGEAAKVIAAMPGIRIEALYTQIPSAYQEDHEQVEAALQRFLAIAQPLKETILPELLLHAASSPMITNFPQAQLDMVRAGIVLFGLRCMGSEEMNLKPVLQLKSHIVRVRSLQPGERYGYSCMANGSFERRVATVQIGYGDALFLFSLQEGQVLIRGQRASMLGRSTMDHLLIDVTAIDGVADGDEVVLIGTQRLAQITAEEVANQAGYNEMNAECITMFGPGVPRFYLKSGA